MSTDLDSINTLLRNRYPHTGVTAEAVDGHALATLTLPSDVSDLGAILASLRSELCVVCDVRTTTGGKQQLDCWSAPRAVSTRSAACVVLAWGILFIIAMCTAGWAFTAFKRH